MQLVEQLMETLGVSEEQAKGGAGLLLKTAKEQLGDKFSQVTDKMPEADDLVKEAESLDSDGDEGGLLGALGDLGGLGDVGGMLGNLGGLGSLVGGFEKLGLDAGSLQQFVPVVMKHLEGIGGGGLGDMLSGLFK